MLTGQPAHTLTLEELQLRCTHLERACVQEGRSSDSDLALARPTAEATAADGIDPWLLYYGWLRVRRSTAGADQRQTMGPSAGEAIRQMTFAEPQRLHLEMDSTDSSEAGDVQYPTGLAVGVYPKSPLALRVLDSLDAQVHGLARASALAMATTNEHDRSVLALVPLTRSLAERVFVWIITHPGSKLPFDRMAVSLPDPPAWTEYYSASDLIRLVVAHREVNGGRQRAIGHAFGAGDRTEPTLPLDGMLAAFTAEKHEPPADILERFSLGEITAAAVASAKLHRDAREQAEQQRGTSGTRGARGAA